MGSSYYSCHATIEAAIFLDLYHNLLFIKDFVIKSPQQGLHNARLTR